MKRLLVAMAVLLALGGCMTQGEVYTWSHPMGGEYLFAFDKAECEAGVGPTEVAQSSDPSMGPEGPFFTCMLDRGYYLVSERGVVRAPTRPTIAAQ
ncbi:MAG: hypothetical protein AAF513_01045 [Pseudomonadota bacterium]